MGYVGGYGGGRGWLETPFLLTPEELEALLFDRKLELIYPDMGVTARYRPPTRVELRRSYKRLLKAAHADAEFDTADVDNLTHSLTHGPRSYRLERVKSGRFVFQLREPVISMGLTSLMDLNSRFFSPTARGNTVVGLRLTFPKVVSTRESDWELQPTDGMPNRKLHDALVADIQALTRPVSFTWKGTRRRTALRASDAMRGWLAEHPSLKRRGFRLA